MPLSPIELFLPNGIAERTVVLGDACPAALFPASAVEDDTGAVDLVVLAPSPSQRRDPLWIREAMRTTAARLSPSGIAYVVFAGRWTRPGSAAARRCCTYRASRTGAISCRSEPLPNAMRSRASCRCPS